MAFKWNSSRLRNVTRWISGFLKVPERIYQRGTRKRRAWNDSCRSSSVKLVDDSKAFAFRCALGIRGLLGDFFNNRKTSAMNIRVPRYSTRGTWSSYAPGPEDLHEGPEFQGPSVSEKLLNSSRSLPRWISELQLHLTVSVCGCFISLDSPIRLIVGYLYITEASNTTSSRSWRWSKSKRCDK